MWHGFQPVRGAPPKQALLFASFCVEIDMMKELWRRVTFHFPLPTVRRGEREPGDRARRKFGAEVSVCGRLQWTRGK